MDKVKVERRGGGATKVGITRLASDNGELEDQIGDRSCCRKAENVDPIPIPEERVSLSLIQIQNFTANSGVQIRRLDLLLPCQFFEYNNPKIQYEKE